MMHLGKMVAVVFATSLALSGFAQAKTTKAPPRTAKQAKGATKQVKQTQMLLPLVGKKSPFGKLAPAPSIVRQTAAPNRRRAAGISGLSRRASRRFAFSRTVKSAMPSNQTILRMRAVKLSSNAVTKVVGSNVAQIHACYERAVAMNRAPKGSVSVRFVIEPNGTVSSTTVACGKRNHVLKRCMERRVKTWKFPKADAPTTVDYPFVFDIAESKVRRTK